MRRQVVTCASCIVCVVLAACTPAILVGDRQFEVSEGAEAVAYFRELSSQALERVEPLERPLAGDVLVVNPSRSDVERFVWATNPQADRDNSTDKLIAGYLTEAWTVDLAEFVAQLERRNIFAEVRIIVREDPAGRQPHEFVIWHELPVGGQSPFVRIAAPGDSHTTPIFIRQYDTEDPVDLRRFWLSEIENFVTAPR